MKLQEQLDKLRDQLNAETPAKALEANQKAIDELRDSKILEKGPKIGDHAPDFEVQRALLKQGDQVKDFVLPDAFGKKVTLSWLLKQGHVVLNFYRGGWCPYCNLELRALQRHLPEFKQWGAQLVAISPEAPDKSVSTAEKLNLDFLILSDLKSSVARQFGIAYPVPGYLRKTYEGFGLDLKAYNNTDTVELPIPATYVIDKNYTIRFAFANEDYTRRADIDEIIESLKRLTS